MKGDFSLFMYPILFKIGPFTVYAYGTLVALGFLTAIYIAKKNAIKENISPDKILDLGFIILISGIIGARLFYVITEIKDYIYNPLDIFKVWEGGLVYYGGFIAGFIAALWYLKKNKLPVWVIADIVAAPIAIGQTYGRIGCFLNGCCYGKYSKNFGVIFHSLQDNFPRIPTQLLEAILTFTIFIILVLFKKYKKLKFAGQIFWIYVLLYSGGRFILEFLRDDDRGPILFSIFSVSQFISICLVVVSAAYLLKIFPKSFDKLSS